MTSSILAAVHWPLGKPAAFASIYMIRYNLFCFWAESVKYSRAEARFLVLSCHHLAPILSTSGWSLSQHCRRSRQGDSSEFEWLALKFACVWVWRPGRCRHDLAASGLTCNDILLLDTYESIQDTTISIATAVDLMPVSNKSTARLSRNSNSSSPSLGRITNPFRIGTLFHNIGYDRTSRS